MEYKKINKVYKQRGGNGGFSSKIAIPTSWLEKCGITEKAVIELVDNKIIIKGE